MESVEEKTAIGVLSVSIQPKQFEYAIRFNSLSLSLTGCRSLQSFKRRLKTHLFKITYGNT